MRFRSHDNLRLFIVVARHSSFTAAAMELNLTKGAVSYQISRLESELGFALFDRRKKGVTLTEKGNHLLYTSKLAFDNIESQISVLQQRRTRGVTIGMSTYLASRWLSPRLMNFTSQYPDIGLRIQPTVGIVDPRKEHIDMLIRWGKGKWKDMKLEPLFSTSTFVTAGKTLAQSANHDGLAALLNNATLLHDLDDSPAWSEWHKMAKLPYRSTRNELVIPDPMCASKR